MDLGCFAALLCRGVSESDRYYLIFHVKIFRIPERHLIHVSRFEARLSRSTVWLDPSSNSSSVVRPDNVPKRILFLEIEPDRKV